MKIADMSPTVTPWVAGRTRRVGKWSYADMINRNGSRIRMVYHYTTLMVGFVERDGWEPWTIMVGHGSVSDQNGVNKLLKDFGYYYSRKGGAKVERVR